MPHPYPPNGSQQAGRHGVVLAVTCLALAVVVSSMASLNVALPDIARQTQADQTQQTWITDAYSLLFASLLLPAGALGDRFGRRLALLVGLAIFALAAGLAALVTDPGQLITLRAVMGMGAALVMPATLSTITGTFPPAQRARAVSVWAAVAGASGVLGLLASGLLLEVWSWPSVFWFNMVVVLVAMAGTLLFVPESAESASSPFDVVGAILAACGVAVLVYALIEAPVNGWTAPTTVGGLALGALILVGFVGWELRRSHPLLDPRLFRNRRFAAGSLSITLQFFALFGFLFLLMQYLQMIRGYSALAAALNLVTMPVGMIPAARLSPRLSARFGARGPWTAGLLLLAAGLAVLAHLDVDSPYGMLAAGLVPLGAGLGLAMPPATTAITDALPPALQNVGSAVNDLARELGGALGIAILGSVLNGTYEARLDLPGVPVRIADEARSSLAIAEAIGGPVLDQARDAFTAGLQFALLGASVAVLMAAVAVPTLLRRRAGTQPADRSSVVHAAPESKRRFEHG